MLLMSLSLALAADPTVEVEGNTIRGSVDIAVPAKRFLAELKDPEWESRVSGTSTRATLKGREGSCQQVAFVSPNPIIEARYEVKRCPTSDGWSASLIESNAFSTYASSWKVVDREGGASITYQVELETSLWVPNSLVRSETRRSVKKMLRSMAAWAEGAAKASAAAEAAQTSD